MNIKRFLVACITCTLILESVAPAFAIGPGNGGFLKKGDKDTFVFSSREATKGANEMGETGKEASKEGRIKSCDARLNALKKSFSQLDILFTNLETKIDDRATRAETLYINTLKPQGVTIASYDTLVASVAAKKTNLQNMVTMLQTDLANVSCTGGGTAMKTQVELVRKDMHAARKGLEEYRKAVTNLVVAVLAVKRKLTPTPTLLPTSTPSTSPTP